MVANQEEKHGQILEQPSSPTLNADIDYRLRKLANLIIDKALAADMMAMSDHGIVNIDNQPLNNKEKYVRQIL